MAYVYGKYKSNVEFFFSRFFRIFLPYWSVLFIFVSLALVSGSLFGDWNKLTPHVEQIQNVPGDGFWLATISNLFILGQDVFFFLDAEPEGGLSFTPNGIHEGAQLWRYVLMPTWSVSVELMLYALVPLLVRLNNLKLGIFVSVTLVLRIFVYEVVGWSNEPWNYRFYPFEIGVFCLGIFSCRYLLSHKEFVGRVVERINKFVGQYWKQVLLLIALFSIAGTATKAAGLILPRNYVDLASYLVWAMTFPFLFTLTKTNDLDRKIGDLSYPIYLIHPFIIHYTKSIFRYFEQSEIFAEGSTMNLLGPISGIGTVLCSILILNYIANPIEKVRYRMAKRVANALGKSSAA